MREVEEGGLATKNAKITKRKQKRRFVDLMVERVRLPSRDSSFVPRYFLFVLFAFFVANLPSSRHHVLDHMSLHIRQPITPTVVQIGELLVIHAEQV